MNGKMFWDGEMVCDKMYKCVVTGIWRGITMAGGIGDIFMTAVWFKQEASQVMFINIAFFIMVAVSQSAIITALVTRSFSEHRSEERKRIQLQDFKCLICGQDRKDFASYEDFEAHRNGIHDPWRYMKLRMYLQDKIAVNRYGLSGIERHVASNLLLLTEDGDITRDVEVLEFMPIRRRGDMLVESEQPQSSILNTLGGTRVMSLVQGITSQCEVLNNMPLSERGGVA